MEKEDLKKTPKESIEKHGYSFVKQLGKGGFGSVNSIFCFIMKISK